MTPSPMVVFGEDWGPHPTSTQHLISNLALDRRVLWVNSVGLRRPRASDLSRIVTKARAIGRTAGCASRGLTIAAPEVVMSAPAVPLPGARVARAANRALWRRTVGAQAKSMGFELPILWTSLPTALDARTAIPHRALVYYCGDEFGALDGVDHAPVLEMESELADAADLIVVSHPQLAKKFNKSKTTVLPHGVDLSRFRGLGEQTQRRRNVAGFLGRLDDRLDYGAIARAAKELPDWTFELVGPHAASSSAEVASLVAMPNVTAPGPVSPEHVPELLIGWTAALLPYRDTAMTRACDPLKLREYLAAGVPVAAYPLQGLLDYRDHLSLCSPDTIVDALRDAASERLEQRAARVASVAGDDWSARAQTLSELLGRFS